MRQASAATCVRACLFAVAWHFFVGVLFIVDRDRDAHVWLSILLALIGALFPVFVAVNMGYQEALKRFRANAVPTNPPWTEMRDNEPEPLCEAITARPSRIVEPSEKRG